jgi:hypothetical protein
VQGVVVRVLELGVGGAGWCGVTVRRYCYGAGRLRSFAAALRQRWRAWPEGSELRRRACGSKEAPSAHVFLARLTTPASRLAGDPGTEAVP